MNQTTISKAVKIRGLRLHTGVEVNLKLRPAPENTGYIFVRTDLDNFEIPASVEYVSHCSYATTLMRRGVVLSTCEHLLSALRGSGVDNCFIELDNIEIPILDGSSEDWIELIGKAGLKKLNATRRTLKVLGRVDFEEDGRKMSVEPSDKFEIECVIDLQSPVHQRRQSFHFVMDERLVRQTDRLGPHVRLSRTRSRCLRKAQPRPRRLARQRHRPDTRRNAKRNAITLRRRIRPPQNPRHHWRRRPPRHADAG